MKTTLSGHFLSVVTLIVDSLQWLGISDGIHFGVLFVISSDTTLHTRSSLNQLNCWMAKPLCFGQLQHCNIIFLLFPGTAGLAPSLGHVCFKHHLNINSLFPLSFLIDLTLLYFSLFHLLLPYFNHVLYPGVSFNVQEAQLVKLLASLFTPPQENGLIYLIGLLGKNKMGVFGSVFFFFPPWKCISLHGRWEDLLHLCCLWQRG